MNNKSILLLFSIVAFGKISVCQERQPDGGGSFLANHQIRDEITPQQRASIIRMLQTNEAMLRREGRLQMPANPTATLFFWPLKQAPGYNDNGFCGISNYVDEDPAFPNHLLDYNCGSRTYDQASGYNHSGIDIFTWPFPWQKMSRNAVQIIAAAPGTILAKTDGNSDQNCAFCVAACDWNSVYVMQVDGSVAWYGHMKSGSLTTKAVGQTVALGEYLGVVGSSGNSTGPHLHFEVYTNSNYTKLIDPFAGVCNFFNTDTSWWANQRPYYVSTLNKVMTHGAAPAMTGCPAGEATNEKINFANGETVYLGSYYCDQQNNHLSVHTVYRPDNTVFSTWNQTSPGYYTGSWWWYSIVLPNPAPTGTWKYEVFYNGSQRQSTYFAVNSSYVVICPGNINVLTSNLTGATYKWQVDKGNGFTDLGDTLVYADTTTRQLRLVNPPSSLYGYKYRCFVNNTSYSNVITVKFINYWTGAANKNWEDPANWSCGNVPDADMDVVIQNSPNAPEVNSNRTCRSTTVNPGTMITVKAGFKLDITH